MLANSMNHYESTLASFVSVWQRDVALYVHEAAILVRELQQFQVKITMSASETFGVWRDGQHDDLVLAVALACWWAERNPPLGEGAFGGGGDSLLADPPEGVFLT
jgi:hypothetical protein